MAEEADKAFVKTFLWPPTPPQTVDIRVGGNTNTREISEVTTCPEFSFCSDANKLERLGRCTGSMSILGQNFHT